MAQEKKLIIDDDWKQQAQKEKEILAEKEKEQAEHPEGDMPPADMSSLISMLATQAFYGLGLIRTHEEQKEIYVDLGMAKYNIDLLDVLNEKTQNNLSDDEQKLLTDTLSQLRMAFVQIAQQVKQAP